MLDSHKFGHLEAGTASGWTQEWQLDLLDSKDGSLSNFCKSLISSSLGACVICTWIGKTRLEKFKVQSKLLVKGITCSNRGVSGFFHLRVVLVY